MAKYTMNTYACDFPPSIIKQIWTKLEKKLDREGGYVQDPDTLDVVDWNRLGAKRKARILDDMMNDRIVNLLGNKDAKHYVDLANGNSTSGKTAKAKSKR